MSSSPVERLDEFFGPNAGYALELLERVQQPQPTAEPEEAVVGLRASAEVSAAAAAAALAQSIRLFGHRGARLDPLGSEPPGDPHLDYGAHGLTEEDLQRLPARSYWAWPIVAGSTSWPTCWANPTHAFWPSSRAASRPVVAPAPRAPTTAGPATSSTTLARAARTTAPTCATAPIANP